VNKQAFKSVSKIISAEPLPLAILILNTPPD